MCGRYENAADDLELKEEFLKYIGDLHIDYDLDEILKTENIAPTDTVKVIVYDKDNDVFKLKTMKWGIRDNIYDNTRKAKGQNPLIQRDVFNSKIETLKKAGTKWKKLMEQSRCIFPMTAFYEWPASMDKKPQRISLAESRIFFAGGIYGGGIDMQRGASIITCEPNLFIKPLHNRMPVLMQTKDAADFLSARDDAAREMCIPLDDEIKMKLESTVLEKPVRIDPGQNSLPFGEG